VKHTVSLVLTGTDDLVSSYESLGNVETYSNSTVLPDFSLTKLIAYES